MDSNHIDKDGFSNPDIERFFTSWDAERAMKNIVTNQNCGACQCACSWLTAPANPSGFCACTSIPLTIWKP